eukprot:g5236.t1
MATCSQGDSFYVDVDYSYDALGTMDGCYGDVGDVFNDLPEYFRDADKSDDTPMVYATTFYTTDPIWVLAHFDAVEEFYRIRCRDADYQDASLIHPSEVTQWDCMDDDDEFTRLDAATATCGCLSTSSDPSSASTSPAPVLTPEPTPVTSPSTPTPVDPNACGETESFRIKSDQLPLVEGCFQATQESFANPGASFEVWTVSGNTQYDQVIVAAIADDGTGEYDDSPYLLAYFGADENNRIGYCLSNENGIDVHPADATWLCDMDGAGGGADNVDVFGSLLAGENTTPDSFVAVTDEDISFTCGCATPAPSQPRPTPSPTPTPASSSSAVPLWAVIGGSVGGAAILALVGVFVAKRRRGSKSKGDSGSTKHAGINNYPVTSGVGSGGGGGGGTGKGGSVPPSLAPPAYSEPNPPKAELYSPGDGGLPPPPPYSEPSPFRG